ncbi:alginate export family protein [Paraflavitalea sp. CAU 1676]|uniref:alginate export family protein n=1 Tax=Paraflavitalea sp. CAU 1676 TaxID=3032598 RepID=UPI0023DA9E00|nr:alginate export family protein [Paraflavitalea sp. CAU 1676]MDF2188058.1 alginate export family protein [Paraflavitalea sp. CAU 1676]
MKNFIAKCTLFVCLGLCSLVTRGQFTLNGQLRTRTEVRNGLGNLVPVGSKTAVFTSQRTRLNFGYKWDRVTFGVSIQDVRVWGQDASSISNADGNRLMLHEGWADIVLANKADTTIKFKLVDQLSVKIGRQELVYDDVRLIGNLDWLQQGRRHDMVLVKLLHKGWQVDAGYAFNQNTDAFGTTGTSYVPGNVPAYIKNSAGTLVPTPAGLIPLTAGGSLANNSVKSGAPVFANPPSTNAATQDYKSFTSLYISRKFNQTKFSALFFNDNFGKYKTDSVTSNGGYVYGRRFAASGKEDAFDYSGTSSRFTYGLMINHTLGNASGFGKIALQAAYYAQSGKDRDGVSLDAYHYTISGLYQKGKWSIGPGYDVLSGNDAVNPSGKNNRFDPLYGTPHRHWGYMDYFYVGTGSPAGGLQNLYGKLKYTANAWSAGVDVHGFWLNKDMKKADGSVIDKNLGTEVDFLLNYNLNKFTNIELGYSVMKATSSMAFAKGQATTDAVADTYRRTGTWFYAMLNIRPDFFFTKPVAIKQ